jgi:hypothetical protein
MGEVNISYKTEIPDNMKGKTITHIKDNAQSVKQVEENTSYTDSQNSTNKTE